MIQSFRTVFVHAKFEPAQIESGESRIEVEKVSCVESEYILAKCDKI